MKIQAFASKEIVELQKRLFKRVSGIQCTLITGANTIIYTVPYSWVKITGLEVISGQGLDVFSVEVLDSVAGTYSGTPSLKLNQFAFSLNVSGGFYAHSSEYDADLYQGMQIKITYSSLSDKTVGFNFILNEVV